MHNRTTALRQYTAVQLPYINLENYNWPTFVVKDTWTKLLHSNKLTHINVEN